LQLILGLPFLLKPFLRFLTLAELFALQRALLLPPQPLPLSFSNLQLQLKPLLLINFSVLQLAPPLPIIFSSLQLAPPLPIITFSALQLAPPLPITF